ncbi:MAG: nucleotide exchange factor GrpE [Maricaulis sp.]|nr:nucleotide exchange factor GrpE [Maricaulis sp.]MDG2043654.1 nucleotide exchange factor GrpE [Maricaulis sp.]
MNDTDNTENPNDEDLDAIAAEEAAESADTAEADEDTVEKLGGQLDDLRDRLLRAVADADNTRKRAEKEVRDTRDYAVSSFAKDMVEVADNLSRALAAVETSADADTSEAMKNLVDGVAMTERVLLSKLERHNVKQVNPEPGHAFDPHQHQAVAQIPSDQASGTIASVMQTGFIIGGRTLRAAMVAVSSGPATTAPTDDTPPETGGSVDIKA